MLLREIIKFIEDSLKLKDDSNYELSISEGL